MNMISFLWRLLRYRGWQYLTEVLAIVTFTGGRLIFGLILQQIFNALPISQSISTRLWFWVVLLLLAGFLRSFIVYIATRASIGYRFSMMSLLQHNLLARVLERPGARAVPNSPGEAISNFRDDTSNIIQATETLASFGGQAFFALGALLILLHVNTMMTLLIFLPLSLVIVVVQFMRKRLNGYRKQSRQATSELIGTIGEVFGAVQAIQVASTEADVVEYVKGLNERRRKLILRDTVFTNTIYAGFSNIVNIAKGFILVLMALSLHAQLHVGDLALFILYLGNITDFIQSLGNVLTQWLQTKVSYERLIALLQGASTQSLVAYTSLYIRGVEPPVISVPTRVSNDVLQELSATSLTFRYRDTGRGIYNLHIHLKKGTITVVTGRIGAGKTTFLQVLLGLLPRDEGEISWNGQPIDDPASFFVPPRSSYTAQVPHLFSDPLKDNILLGLPEEQVKLQQAIHTTVMEHDIIQLEHGLDTLIGVRGVKLSGGQVQRTAAMRMLVRETELLVFDDLSSALDIETENLLWERLFVQSDHTCLIVSHRKAVLQRANHIIVLKEGKLEAEGTLVDLLKTNTEMQLLWDGEWQREDTQKI